MAKSKRYTYIDFGEDVQKLLAGELELTPDLIAKMTEKAQDTIATHTNKKNYNADPAHQKPKKGPGPDVLARVEVLAPALPVGIENALTFFEFNDLLEVNYTALNVNKAMEYIPGALETEVVRARINSKGLRIENHYKAYYKDAEGDETETEGENREYYKDLESEDGEPIEG